MSALVTPDIQCASPTCREVSAFLSEYCVILFGSGATCIRMDKNVRRIADALSMRVEYSVLPRHIHLTVQGCGPDDEAITSVVAIREMPISYSKISSLSKLSWQIHDGTEDFYSARKCLRRIAATPYTDTRSLLLLVSVANASFCHLFGGDAIAMILVFIATFLGFLLKIQLNRAHVDFRLTTIFCAFLSTLVASIDFMFGLGNTPQLAVSASVLYLVPGIPFINSFCDFIDRHYLCAIGRLVNAIVILCCLSLGLCAGMLVLNLNMF